MAEIWVAGAVAVVGGIASGMAAEKKAKAEAKEARGMTREQAILSSRGEGYSKALDEYYREKGRYGTQRGLDEFRKFSTTANFAPGYEDTAARLQNPVMPTIEQFFPKEPPKPKKKKKKRGGLRGFIDKVDPLGSKLIDIDPLSSSVLGKSYTYENVPQSGIQAPIIPATPTTGGGD